MTESEVGQSVGDESDDRVQYGQFYLKCPCSYLVQLHKRTGVRFCLIACPSVNTDLDWVVDLEMAVNIKALI
jgi:hypothetical protein